MFISNVTNINLFDMILKCGKVIWKNSKYKLHMICKEKTIPLSKTLFNKDDLKHIWF